MVANAGKGCLLTQFDASDAYKQLQVRDEDLHQQIFMANGKFWVDFCASFGSLYGNDIYSAFGNAHCICLAFAAALPLLRVYVDNYINITPACGERTEQIAKAEKMRLLVELIKSGLKFHKFQGPTTILDFLGATFNTEAMTVAIPEERIRFMIAYIKEWRCKTSYTLKELSSLIGLLLYAGQLALGLKSAAGWLLKKKAALLKSPDTHARCGNRIRASLARTQYILERWNGTARIYDMDWQTGPDLTIFCDAAIDKPFPKAGSFGKGAYAMPTGQKRSAPWTEEEAAESKRLGKKAASSSYLELVNMLESILLLAKEKQKVLCYCDNTGAVTIARERYTKIESKKMTERLQDFDLACLQRCLSVRFEWKSEEEAEMALADKLSRGWQVQTTA